MDRYIGTDVYPEVMLRTNISQCKPGGVICEGRGQVVLWRGDDPGLRGVSHWQS